MTPHPKCLQHQPAKFARMLLQVPASPFTALLRLHAFASSAMCLLHRPTQSAVNRTETTRQESRCVDILHYLRHGRGLSCHRLPSFFALRLLRDHALPVALASTSLLSWRDHLPRALQLPMLWWGFGPLRGVWVWQTCQTPACPECRGYCQALE